MISEQLSALVVRTVPTNSGNYFTLTEDNLGSAHHVTFNEGDLKKVLHKLDEKRFDIRRDPSNEGYLIDHGDVYTGAPLPGFIQIWESKMSIHKRRSICLNHEQVKDLLDHFRGTLLKK